MVILIIAGVTYFSFSMPTWWWLMMAGLWVINTTLTAYWRWPYIAINSEYDKLLMVNGSNYERLKYLEEYAEEYKVPSWRRKFPL